MKKIFIIKLFIVSLILSQSNDINDALQFFPLHIGDYWQYKVTRNPFGIQDSNWIGYKEVIGDTIMQNGKKYFIIKEDRLPIQHYYKPYFIRVDSNTANVYKYNYEGKEVLIDSLLTKKGDVILHGFKCTMDTLKNYFGVNVNTRLIEQYMTSSTSYTGWQRAKIFGEVMRYYDDIFIYYIHYQCDINYAKINGQEYGTKTNINTKDELPNQIKLFQNYPNPFNPTTTIKYSIPYSERVMIKVYDLLGREIKTLLNDYKNAGTYEIEFNASNFASGIYFYRIISGNYYETKKMILLN